jgi:ABC-type multidrug transport system fused ATPase/permease subunit
MFDSLDRPDSRGLNEGTIAISERLHRHIDSGYQGFEANVCVQDVSLTFTDSTSPVIDHVSFDVPMGSSMAFVGSTGAGKSTLADLVLGVLAPDSGQITLGGEAPRQAIHRWPGAIAYVPQNVALVAGTVKQNVALGMPTSAIRDELVWEALRRAHLADFLTDHREGLNTWIGERGFKLSGGQRQRLGIARALYTRPKLLVLDEATSALDAETELAIIETLAELEGEVTTITVAHRLATARNADHIVYLDSGRIVAMGTFDEVRAQSSDFDHQAKLLGL